MLHPTILQNDLPNSFPDRNSDSTRTYGTNHGSNRDSLLLDTECYEYEEIRRRENNEYDNSLLIYRFEFTDEFIQNLSQFSKIHQYDARQDFKEAWKKWTEENQEKIHKEITRLTELGYRGNIPDKMFKSARYYFRKKNTNTPQEPKTRRAYTGTNKSLLESMDQFILEQREKKMKPADSFLHFCEENKELLKQEILHLINQGYKEKEEIKNKIKKTYKNRYFIVINK
jgi:hypothetical protein